MVTFFKRMLQFYIKKKLKSEFIQENSKNLVTFKRWVGLKDEHFYHEGSLKNLIL